MILVPFILSFSPIPSLAMLTKRPKQCRGYNENLTCEEFSGRTQRYLGLTTFPIHLPTFSESCQDSTTCKL